MSTSTDHLIIRPLEPSLLDDYLDFFDNVAFNDHQEWSWCYCTFYHFGKQDEENMAAQGSFDKNTTRNMAITMIQEGKLKGYLAYEHDKVVGWCNVADKKTYKRLCENRDIWDTGEDLPIKSVTCFIVAPEARRKGVAAALLVQASEDAAAQGFQYIEAYPAGGAHDCFHHYHGHPAMYEKNGFVLHKDLKDYSIYRKPLMS